MGFIICLQETTTAPQPQKRNCSHKLVPHQSVIDPVSIQSPNSVGSTQHMLIYIKQPTALLSQTTEETEVRQQRQFPDGQSSIKKKKIQTGKFSFLKSPHWILLAIYPGTVICFFPPQLLHRGQSGEMALFCFLILTSLCIAGREALSISDCGQYARRPGEWWFPTLNVFFCTDVVMLILV